LGAQADLSPGDRRWLSPLALWAGILAGPLAWAVDLMASYAMVKPVCQAGRDTPLHAITIGCLAVVLGGAALSWLAWQRTRADVPGDGGRPRNRVRFMAVLGLASCALFALQIVAAAIPGLVIDACQ
jgi:hypothetical protein